jgi:putative Mn2+ efflux pump MntP
MAFVSMLTAFMTTMGAKGGAFIWQFLSGIISWVAIGLIIAIQVKLLKTAIEPDVSKKQNVLKTFAIIATISSVLAFALNVVSQIILNEFSIMLLVRRFFVYGLDVAVIWAVALVNPDDEKKCKFAYTILPLIAISQSFVFTLISL